MNKINKVTLITAIFISLNGTGNAAPPKKIDAKSKLPIGSGSCSIALGSSACPINIYALNLNTRFPEYTNTSVFNSITEHTTPTPDLKRYTFTLVAHPGGPTYSNYESLKKKEFVSARFRLSGATHNERLEIVDSESSNAHTQFNMMLELGSQPTIEEYMQFFLDSGYFTVAK